MRIYQCTIHARSLIIGQMKFEILIENFTKCQSLYAVMQNDETGPPSDQQFIAAVNSIDVNREYVKHWLHILARIDFKFASKNDIQFAAVITTLIVNKIISTKIDKITTSIFFDCVCVGRHLVNLTIQLLLHAMSPSCIADIFLARKLQWKQNLMIPQRTYRKHNVPYGFSHILALLMANNRFFDISINDIIGHSFILFLSTISNPAKMLTLPEFHGIFREYKFEMLLKNDFFEENKFNEMKGDELIEYVANIDFPAFSLLHAPIRYLMRECFNKIPPTPVKIPDFCSRVHEMLEDDPTFAIDTLSSLLSFVHVKPSEAPVHLLCIGSHSCVFLLFEALLDLYTEVDMSFVNEMINKQTSPNPTIALCLASNLKIPSLRVLSERNEFDSLGSEWQTALVPIKKHLGFKTETENLIKMLNTPSRNWAIASLLQDVASLPYLTGDSEQIKLIRQFLSESTDLPRNRVDSITAMSLVNMSIHPAWENAPALLDHAIVLCDMVNRFTLKFPPPIAAAVKIGAKLKSLEQFVSAMPRRTVMSLFEGPMSQIECIKTHVVHLTSALKNMSPLVVGGDALAALVELSLSGILCVEIADDLEECIGQRFVSARTSIALSLVSNALQSEFVTEVIDASMPFLKLDEGFEVSLTALTRLVDIKSPSSIRIIKEIDNLGKQYLKECGLKRIIALTECLLSFGYIDLMDEIINRIYLYGTPLEFLAVISKFILKNPSELISVSDKLLDLPKSRPYLLHLIATSDSPSKELIELGLRIVRRCGEYNYDYEIETTPKQPPSFPEDNCNDIKIKKEEINLCGECTGLSQVQSFFTCQTCEMSGICIHCAIRCHSGHNLIPQQTVLGVCQCQLQHYCKFISPSLLSRDDLTLLALKVIQADYSEETIEIIQKPTHEREGAFVLSEKRKQIIDIKTYWERIQKSTSQEVIAIRMRCAPTKLCVTFHQFVVYTNGFQVIFEDGFASHKREIRLNYGILSLVPLSNCVAAIHGSSVVLLDSEHIIAEIKPSVIGTVLNVSEIITGHGQPNMIGLVSTRSIDIFAPKNNFKVPITATRNMNITSAVFIGSPLKSDTFCIVCSHPDSSLSILRSTPRGLVKAEGLPVGILQEPIVSMWNDRVFISGSCGRLVCTTVKSILQKDIQIVSIDLPKESSPVSCIGEVSISEISTIAFQSPTGVLTLVTPNDREISVTSVGKLSTIISFRPFILDCDGFVRRIELGRAHRKAPPPEWLSFKPLLYTNCDMKPGGITLSCNGRSFNPGTSFIDGTMCIDITSTVGDIVAIALDVDAVSAGDTGIDVDIGGWPCPGENSPYFGVIKPSKSAFVEITTEGEVEVRWIKVFIGENKTVHPGCERDGSILCSIARSMSSESPPISSNTISQLAEVSYTKGGRWVREMIRRSGSILHPEMLLSLKDIGGAAMAVSADGVEEDIRMIETNLPENGFKEIQKVIFSQNAVSESKLRLIFL